MTSNRHIFLSAGNSPRELQILTGNFSSFHYFVASTILLFLSDLFIMRRHKLISLVSHRDKEMAKITRDDVNEHLIAVKLTLGRYCIMPLINESSNYYNRSCKLNWTAGIMQRDEEKGKRRKRNDTIDRCSVQLWGGPVRSCCRFFVIDYGRPAIRGRKINTALPSVCIAPYSRIILGFEISKAAVVDPAPSTRFCRFLLNAGEVKSSNGIWSKP